MSNLFKKAWKNRMVEDNKILSNQERKELSEQSRSQGTSTFVLLTKAATNFA